VQLIRVAAYTAKNTLSAANTFCSLYSWFYSTMIKEYVAQVITGMKNDPEIVYARYYEKMREYLTKAFNGDQF